MNKKTVKKGIIPYIVLSIFIVSVLYFMNMANNKVKEFTYNTFISEIEKAYLSLQKITADLKLHKIKHKATYQTE